MFEGVGAYYNEIDPDAVLILRALIEDGVIAPGVIDSRSISEVQPDDLDGFTQCHFFAGGGLWSVAARLAGWPDDRPIWTASCPCQPFSVAGKGAGADDARHLWPDVLRLASAKRPPVIVGEQVAGKAGYGWFDGVRADLASEGYASRYVDIPACAVDAPHIRQRGYWVALADAEECSGRARLCQDDAIVNRAVTANGDGGDCPACGGSGRCGPYFPGGLSTVCGNCFPGGDAFSARLEGQRGHGDDTTGRAVADRSVAAANGGDVGDAASGRWVQGVNGPEAARHGDQPSSAYGRNGSFWTDHEWIACHDGKARRTQPGVPLLVDGLPGRVGLWRVAGNAISPVLAAEVLGALIDDLDERLAA